MAMAPLESIDPTLLAAVTGGDMQFHPGLQGTLEGHTRRNRTTKPAPEMVELVNGLGTAMSGLSTGIAQSKQQSSQALMQMLPQMMGR
jgi:hypothetical protein